jgi:hypothetical protein
MMQDIKECGRYVVRVCVCVNVVIGLGRLFEDSKRSPG